MFRQWQDENLKPLGILDRLALIIAKLHQLLIWNSGGDTHILWCDRRRWRMEDERRLAKKLQKL